MLWIKWRRRIQKFRHHLSKWNEWRKHNTNSKWHKFLVLIGVRESPTMKWTLTKKEKKAFHEGVMEGMEAYKHGNNTPEQRGRGE